MNASASSHQSPEHRKALAALVLGAIGVVFGDIGTSPLYALKEAFSPEHGIPLTPDNVMGILSLIVWSMVWVITIKYLLVMMRAGKVGTFFGPVTVLWFLSIGAIGAAQLAKNPAVLAALQPAYAVDFMFAYPGLGFLVLGAVFLALTGGEALYADMGHFGKRPIR